MKSFVITIKSEPKSVAIAQRCINSMPQFDVQMFDAITPKDDPLKMAKEKVSFCGKMEASQLGTPLNTNNLSRPRTASKDALIIILHITIITMRGLENP